MAGDSAFRRLLLDTVAATLTQPPSSNSLIELLRITTPSLTTNNPKLRDEVYAKVRNVSQREKLFRTLQLRIHPDKHPGDERATALFQEVTLYYQKCVEVLEREDRRQWNENNHCNIDTAKSRAASTATPAHSDYENVQFEQNIQNPRRGTISQKRQGKIATEPPAHQAFAAISLVFPPLGAMALYHSLKVRPSWKEGRFADARHHSTQAYSFAWWGLLCAGCIILYFWLSDGDFDFDWERIKHNLPWDNGP